MEMTETSKKISEALIVSTEKDEDHHNTAIRLEFYCIPVSPGLVADIGLIEDEATRKILQRFILRNTQVIYSKQVVSDENLEAINPDFKEHIENDIIETSVIRLLEEFRTTFISKIKSKVAFRKGSLL